MHNKFIRPPNERFIPSCQKSSNNFLIFLLRFNHQYAQGPQSKLCILMLNFNAVFSRKLMT